LTPQKPILQKKIKLTKGDDAFQDPYLENRATYIGIGEYKLELTVGAHTVTQTWKVTK